MVWQFWWGEAWSCVVVLGEVWSGSFGEVWSGDVGIGVVT